MTIDTHILNPLILNYAVINHLNKGVVWGSVMDINAKAGIIYTGGIDVSVLKQNNETKKKGVGGKKSISLVENEFRYAEALEKEKLKLRNDVKLGHIIATELFMSQHNSSTTSKEKSINYLQEKARVTPAMKAYYANEDNSAVEDQHTSSLLPFRKMKLSNLINQLKADKRLAKNIRKRFGNYASARQSENQKSIRGIFKTSSLYPACQNYELEILKKCLIPVTESTEDNTWSSLYRLWNRAMVTTLNFRHILFDLRKDRRRPENFCRLSARSFTTLKRKKKL
ncbi:hypothetical protein J3Q64DRAFT_1815189 [Phycomyces blakesleeanus]|uniref:Uncharacterized protein n=1 Tax=Phycomyces blakesleeanus TaxID=4837 RepID=A0ABR3ATK5_PHYBL